MDHLEEKHADTKRGLSYRYYISSGSQADASKPVLLLCHGFPDDAKLWQFIVPHLLTTKLRIIVPDLLGAGGTSTPTDPTKFEISAMVDDIVEVLDKERVTENVIPIGHDWGAYFTQRFYLLNKSRCVGLINLSLTLMPPFKEPFDVAAINKQAEETIGYPLYEYWNFFLAPDAPALMESNVEGVWTIIGGDEENWARKVLCVPNAVRELLEQPKPVSLKPWAQNEQLKNQWIAGRKKSGFASQINWYRAVAENHNLETEKRLDGLVEKPYLFIGCDGDVVCRTDLIERPKQMGLLPDMEVHELHSAHHSPYEKPEETANIIVDWLRKKDFLGHE